MSRALELAARGRFSVSPNPMVGCVIERDGHILGEGFHVRAGEPHAEVVALQSCSDDPRGATAWVTLEPCTHFGRTPPCTDALLQAGVTRVEVAVEDPSPNIAGRGIDLLRSHGVEVGLGIDAEKARLLNETFLFSVAQRRPFVLLKAGMTIDGKLANSRRQSRWITSEESRRRSLELREEFDAILVGSGTIIDDDPSLSRRLKLNQSVQPWTRVVVDSSGRIPLQARILTDEGRTILFTNQPALYGLRNGVEIIEAPSEAGRIDLNFVFRVLDERGVRSLIAEGGSLLHTQLLLQGLWQKMVLFVAPAVVGGASSPSIFSTEELTDLTEARRFRFDRVEPVGPDLMITAYPHDAAGSPPHVIPTS